MLIGIDISRANREHKSGTEWYSYYLVRWLAKLDKHNEYILYTDNPLKDGLLDLTTKQYYKNRKEEKIIYDKKGYQVIKSPFNNFRVKILKWPIKYFWTQGRLSLEMLFNPPDLLFIPSHTLPIIHPKKSLVTIHDIGFERDRRLYKREDMVPNTYNARRFINILVKLFTFGKYGANTVDYFRWSTEYALRKAYKIITVSNFSKKELKQFFQVDSNKIKIIHNGYNKYLYRKINNKEKINKVLAKYDIDGPYLFYVGRIEKKKNTPALIEAFGILNEDKTINHKLVLVGDASYGYDETNFMISEFDLLNKVIMPGWVEEEDLPYLFNGAQVFIFPSYYEGFGIPLLQAMRCGIPVCASYSSSIPEVVGDAALFFDPHDVRSIAEAMKKIINDRELREKLIQKGNDRIKKFSWEKSAEETLNVIKGL